MHGGREHGLFFVDSMEHHNSSLVVTPNLPSMTAKAKTSSSSSQDMDRSDDLSITTINARDQEMKSDSKATSMGASSSSTPQGHLYFMQSPTLRDSFLDDDKTPFSFHSANFTLLGWPSHQSMYASLLGHHSKNSSGTHFWGEAIPDANHSRNKWHHTNAIA